MAIQYRPLFSAIPSTPKMTAALPPPTYTARSQGKLQSRTRHTIDLTDLTPNNIGQLRKLNSVLFPVKYSQGFYDEALREERRRVNKLALFNDIPVGNLVCRYEFPSSGQVEIYIMTLGVLAPYRRLGIASTLINHILSEVTPGSTISLPENGKSNEYNVDRIYLHVQTDNSEAREFYKKLGFVETHIVEEYYRQGVQCRSAVVLEKRD